MNNENKVPLQPEITENAQKAETNIIKLRQERLEACKNELRLVLKKFEFDLKAEHELAPGVTITSDIHFVDFHNYDAEIAQASEVKSPYNESDLGQKYPDNK